MGSLPASYSKKIISVVTLSIIFTFFVIYSEIPTATAQTEEYEFTIIEGEDLITNPTARGILEKIELSKKILADLQSNSVVSLNEHQKFIEEQRKLSQAKLDAELERMNKKYEDFTPRNAFASYVSDKPEYMQAFYWDQFNYLNDKVLHAKHQRDQILNNGGTFSQAQQVFLEHAKFPKSEVKSVFDELVEKHNLYDHYSGELDPDKWYPKEAVQAFEAWTDNAQNRYSVDTENQAQNLEVQIENNEIIQNVSLESASVFDTESKFEMIVNDLPSPEIDYSDAIELNGQTFNEIDGSVLNGASEFTASAWIKPNYDKGSTSFTILSKPGVFKMTLNNYIEPRHAVEFSVFDGIKWNTVKSFSTINEEWTHVAGVFKDSILSLYVDGKLEAMYNMGGIISLNDKGIIEKMPLRLKTSPEEINIGVQQIIKLDEQKTKNFFSGLIDYVLVQDKALSNGEISNIINTI
jgi:hypothetical protein